VGRSATLSLITSGWIFRRPPARPAPGIVAGRAGTLELPSYPAAAGGASAWNAGFVDISAARKQLTPKATRIAPDERNTQSEHAG